MAETEQQDAVVATTEAPVAPARPVVKKLAEIMKAVGRIKKQGWNDHFNYPFVRESDLADAVQAKLAAAGVLLLPSVDSVERSEPREKGKMITTVRMTMTFVDAESGDEVSFQWAGQGEDNSDKGAAKAETSCVKYALLKLFLVPTGDADPDEARKEPGGRRRSQASEPRDESDQRRPSSDDGDEKIPVAMVKRLLDALATHNVDVKAFGAQVRARYGASKWGDLKRRHFGKVMAAAQAGGDFATTE